MSRIVSQDQLYNAVDEELGWRKKELKILKDNIPPVKSPLQLALLRSSILILYAHWEGYVKNICEFYLEYVANKRELYINLKPQFITLGLNKVLGKLEVRNVKDKSDAINFIIDNLQRESDINVRGSINTKSNLKFNVFEDICFILNLNVISFHKYKDLINDLVDTRNTIAHGGRQDTLLRIYDGFYNDTIELMESLRTEIQNSVALNTHKI